MNCVFALLSNGFSGPFSNEKSAAAISAAALSPLSLCPCELPASSAMTTTIVGGLAGVMIVIGVVIRRIISAAIRSAARRHRSRCRAFARPKTEHLEKVVKAAGLTG